MSASALLGDIMISTYSFVSHAAVAVGRILFPLFALSLDLPERYFDDKVQCRCNECYVIFGHSLNVL